VRGSESGTNPTQIKLEGPSGSIMKFVAEYLSDACQSASTGCSTARARDLKVRGCGSREGSGCQSKTTAKSV